MRPTDRPSLDVTRIGGNLVAQDNSTQANPTLPLTALELDVFANDTDANKQRTGLLIVTGKAGGTGVAPHVSQAIFIGAGTSGGIFDTLLRASITSAGTGIDFSPVAFSNAAILLKDSQKIAFEATNNHSISYAAGTLTYNNPGGLGFGLQIFDNGGLRFGMSAADLTSPIRGEVYYNSTVDELKYYNNSAWRTFADLESAQTISGVKTFSAAPKLPAYTVAGLPACNAGAQNSIAVVSDATAPTYNGALVGGGAVRTLAFCDGSAWTSH